jgi:hypothetical protein
MDRVRRSTLRSGLTFVEVLVLAVLVVLVALLLLIAVPRAREQARLTGCRKNLSQIGVALAMYDQTHLQLPMVADLAALDGPARTRAAAPLQILLETLQLPDLTELVDPKKVPPPRPGEVPGARPVPGFVCASDPNALAGHFPAPISYRGVTGDSPAGDNGVFAPERSLSVQQVEAVDGSSYTAAFSERLAGDNQSGHATMANYAAVAGPVSPRGCPVDLDRSAWRGDAGSSWRSCDYRSTLYNHAAPPNAHPSCVAVDGQSARMGASSGHQRGVHLLLLDGSVTLVRSAIDEKVWKEFARIGRLEPVGLGPLFARGSSLRTSLSHAAPTATPNGREVTNKDQGRRIKDQ